MIVEPLVTGCVRFCALGAVPEKTQGGESAFHSRGARHESAFDAYRVGCQRKPGCRNACRPIGGIFIDDQTVTGICLTQEITERLPLYFFQFRINSAHGLKETGYAQARD